MASNGKPSSLALLEFSDRELMNIVLDVADPEGWTTSQDVADAIGVRNDRPTQCVGTRFSWMRRYGVMEREGARWRLTSAGYRIALGALTPQEQQSLKDLSVEQLMDATALLTQRYRRINAPAANMMRRAWRHGTQQR